MVGHSMKSEIPGGPNLILPHPIGLIDGLAHVTTFGLSTAVHLAI